MEGPYKLVNALHAHDGPVRSIAIDINGEIVTGCQSDSPCVRRWSVSQDTVEELGGAMYHDHWVTAVTILPVDSSRIVYPEGCLITGCMDNKIRIFDRNGSLLHTLEGHTKGVISFSWTNTGMLLSGSWDGSAMVWNLETHACVQRLQPHENGVHVLGLSNSTVATTSTGESVDGKPANYKLRIWDPSTGGLVGVPITDHAGSIRSVAALPGINGFATTANDGTVALRSIDGEVMGTMYHAPQEDGSAPFILDCCSLSSTPGDGSMDLVSCGEDGSVMVWSGTEAVQSIPHPTSVWRVAALGGGDFVTAGHDGVVRFFSRNAERISQSAVAAQLTADFVSEVLEAQQAKRRGPSSEELAKAAPWDDRGRHPGTSENQVMVFNRDGVMIAAQWNSGAWVVIGEVTGSGDGGHIDGVWFDHVMPVEIETPGGLRTLKLGHNNGENPFVAAQRFIDAHQLGQAYLGQISDWISSRAGHSTPTLGAAPGGSGGHTGSANVGAYSASPRPAVFPSKVVAPVTFEEIPAPAKLLAKLSELNSACPPSQALSEREMELVQSVLATLCETSYYHSSAVSADQVRAVARMALAWDATAVFPAYDILRLVAVHPAGAETLASVIASGSPLVQETLELLSRGGEVVVPHTAALTASRFICNLFKSNALRSHLMAAHCRQVLAAAETQDAHSNKSVRAAAATIAMNVAATVASPVGGDVAEVKNAVLRVCCGLIRAEKESSDVIFRALRALGTVVASTAEGSAERAAVTSGVDIAGLLVQLAGEWSATRLGDAALKCLQEVLVLTAA